jgi:hypothetical protein
MNEQNFVPAVDFLDSYPGADPTESEVREWVFSTDPAPRLTLKPKMPAEEKQDIMSITRKMVG